MALLFLSPNEWSPVTRSEQLRLNSQCGMSCCPHSLLLVMEINVSTSFWQVTSLWSLEVGINVASVISPGYLSGSKWQIMKSCSHVTKCMRHENKKTDGHWVDNTYIIIIRDKRFKPFLFWLRHGHLANFVTSHLASVYSRRKSNFETHYPLQWRIQDFWGGATQKVEA